MVYYVILCCDVLLQCLVTVVTCCNGIHYRRLLTPFVKVGGANFIQLSILCDCQIDCLNFKS